MLLFVIRHAKAADRSTQEWPDDSQRPLTKDGRRKFKPLARRVGDVYDHPARVLSSGFVRAWQTARLLESAAGWPEPTRCEQLECDYFGGVASVCELLAQCEDASIALVGHEPMLSELVSELIGTELPSIVMKKGAIAVLEIAMTLHAAGERNSLFGTASLVALLDPQSVGGRSKKR